MADIEFLSTDKDPFFISWIMNPYSQNSAYSSLKNIIARLPHKIQILENGKDQVTVQTKSLSRKDSSFMWALINQTSEDPIECCLTLDKDHSPIIITEALDKIKYLIPKLTGQAVESIEIHKISLWATSYVNPLEILENTNIKINTNNSFLAQRLRTLKIDEINLFSKPTTDYQQLVYKFIPRAIDGSPHTIPSEIIPEVNTICPLNDLIDYRILLIKINNKVQVGDYSLLFIYVQQSNPKWQEYVSINYNNITFISRDIPLDEENSIINRIESLIESGTQLISLKSDLVGFTIPLFRELCEMWEIDILYHDYQNDTWLIKSGTKIRNKWSIVKSINSWLGDNVTLLSRGLLPRHTFTGTWQYHHKSQGPNIALAIISSHNDLSYVVNYDELTINKDLSFTAHIASYRDSEKLYYHVLKNIERYKSWKYVTCDNILQLVVRRWQLWSQHKIISLGLQLGDIFYLLAENIIKFDRYEEFKNSLISEMTNFLADCSPEISTKDLSALLNISYTSLPNGTITKAAKACVSNNDLDKYRQIIASTPLQLFPLNVELGLSRYRNSYYGLLGYFDIGPIPGRQKLPPVISRFHPSDGEIGVTNADGYQHFYIKTARDSRPFFSIKLSSDIGEFLVKLQELWDDGLFMTPWGSIYQHRTGWMSYAFRSPYFGLHTADSTAEHGFKVQEKLFH